MDWNRVEGNWKQIKGKVKEKWGKLKDDDVNVINGHREQLEGKIQQRYGFAKDQIRKDIDDWYSQSKVELTFRVRRDVGFFLCLDHTTVEPCSRARSYA
jgi:uncharacterized protein YjbJ (UPF0337 family)